MPQDMKDGKAVLFFVPFFMEEVVEGKKKGEQKT